MYSRTVGGGSLPGCGPWRLALGMMPLPLATSRCLPSGVTRTDVGYQPTGIKPSERLLPMSEISNTATALIFALATNRSFSSGERARLFGVEPGGELGINSATSVSLIRPLSALMMETVLRFAFATNRYSADFDRSISFGCSSVVQRVMIWLFLRSITATAACAHKLTYRRSRFSSSTQV